MYQLNGTISAPTPVGPITVTKLTGWSYLGCYNESTTGRALTGLENPIPGANNSVEACSAACGTWTYFGVEYGEFFPLNSRLRRRSLVDYVGRNNSETNDNRELSGDECYCSNTLNAGATLQTGTAPGTTGCNVICKGNTTEYCGGSLRLNLYQAL